MQIERPRGGKYVYLDFGKYIYLAHLAGDAVSQPWVDAITYGLTEGDLPEEIGDYLNERIMYELGRVFDDIMINTNSLITNDILGALLKSTFVNALGGNPAPLGGILNLFGIDFLALLGGDSLGGIISGDMVSDLGDMVSGLSASFIEGAGNDIGDNIATTVISAVCAIHGCRYLMNCQLTRCLTVGCRPA